MKKHVLVAAAAVVAMTFAVPPASASRYDNQVDTHPLKVVGYGFHAVGEGLSWAIFRPIHWVVTRDCFDIVFGHKADVLEDGTEFLWEHGDYSPSIMVERRDRDNRGSKSAAKKPASTRPATRK